MSRGQQALVGVHALFLVLFVAGYGFMAGWYVEKHEPEALRALLAPSLQVYRPEGAGPFPTIVQFSDCFGVRGSQHVWAEHFTESGWASIIVDSVTPRGIDGLSVCAGRRLLGSERAGDVAVALAHVRELAFVDSEELVLAGWSHGAWSIMDLLSMQDDGALPHNLTALPAEPLAGVRALVFVYPYCGFGARAKPWDTAFPALFVIAEADQISPPPECLSVSRALEDQGHSVRVALIPGVDHGFDEPDATRGPHVYNAEATKAAQAHASRFLEGLGERRVATESLRY